MIFKALPDHAKRDIRGLGKDFNVSGINDPSTVFCRICKTKINFTLNYFAIPITLLVGKHP